MEKLYVQNGLALGARWNATEAASTLGSLVLRILQVLGVLLRGSSEAASAWKWMRAGSRSNTNIERYERLNSRKLNPEG